MPFLCLSFQFSFNHPSTDCFIVQSIRSLQHQRSHDTSSTTIHHPRSRRGARVYTAERLHEIQEAPYRTRTIQAEITIYHARLRNENDRVLYPLIIKFLANRLELLRIESRRMDVTHYFGFNEACNLLLFETAATFPMFLNPLWFEAFRPTGVVSSISLLAHYVSRICWHPISYQQWNRCSRAIQRILEIVDEGSPITLRATSPQPRINHLYRLLPEDPSSPLESDEVSDNGTISNLYRNDTEHHCLLISVDEWLSDQVIERVEEYESEIHMLSGRFPINFAGFLNYDEPVEVVLELGRRLLTYPWLSAQQRRQINFYVDQAYTRRGNRHGDVVEDWERRDMIRRNW
ncbi:hypothetical protein M501DRAFT_531983 [Patellaria atrata CBS 101060]|uniref:Uncharacterized protein n=1 Tax=Patellaria atrata CBS 101060 TaxID=1346257 RepID=A0A9P4SF72_9PEZI|nr:hypothetical protein M501DRAFT_531983 [Patellaria atrata CBS 101060]